MMKVIGRGSELVGGGYLWLRKSRLERRGEPWSQSCPSIGQGVSGVGAGGGERRLEPSCGRLSKSSWPFQGPLYQNTWSRSQNGPFHSISHGWSLSSFPELSPPWLCTTPLSPSSFTAFQLIIRFLSLLLFSLGLKAGGRGPICCPYIFPWVFILSGTFVVSQIRLSLTPAVLSSSISIFYLLWSLLTSWHRESQAQHSVTIRFFLKKTLVSHLPDLQSLDLFFF